VVANQPGLAKGLRVAGRVIGLAVTVFGLMMAVGEGIQSLLTQGFGPINLVFFGGFFIVLSMVIALAGCVLSWWRLRPAGILLVLTFIGLITAGILAGGPVDYPERFSLSFILRNIMWASTMGSSFLVAGVLFLVSWGLSRRKV
jgi:hypothetical protein